MNIPSPKKIASNLLLLGLSLIFALTAAEGLLRLFPQLLPEEAQIRIHWREMLGQNTVSVAHPYLGFVYPPHLRRTLSRGDVQFTYKTDEHGFRNPSPWPSEAEIVAVGKSIINLGLIGAAPQQYLRIYETFGVALRPKLLLLGLLPANDVLDAQSFEDWLQAGAQGNYDVWRFFRGKPARKSYPPSCEICLLYMAHESLKRSSYLYTVFNEARKSYRHPAERMRLPNGGRMTFLPTMLERSTAGIKTDEPIFQLVINTIEQTQKLAQGFGTELLVILIPSKESVYLPVLGKPSPEPIDVILREFEKRRIPYLDLRPYLQRLARQNEILYFEVDGHMNARGNAAVADAVLARLRAGADRGID
jgi:hypothetical protein